MKKSSVKVAAAWSVDGLLALPAAVAILYFGRPVLLPLVLAALGAFVLSPLVTAVERSGLPRAAAVLLVVIFSGIVIGASAYGVAQQVGSMMSDLPARTSQMQDRVKSIRDASSPLADVARTFERLQANNVKQQDKTVIVEQRSSFFDNAFEYLRTAAGPAATLFLVMVLLIFTLIRREDLRNRLVGVMGHDNLIDATRVMVDSAERLSKMLATQVAINAGLGIAFGIGLWALDVPYWFLWAALTMVLRFVPFLGVWMAAMLPFFTCLLLFPGWGKPLSVLALFAVLDLVTANAVEPMLIGRRTGVTPIALLVAAVFWTWLWGAVGLLVSTPLTLCLVVLGQHVPRLRFLSVLLGDASPLTPFDQYYQRLLAGDEPEALEVAQAFVALHPEKLVDELLIHALRSAGRDRARGVITPDDDAFICAATERIGERLIPKVETPAGAPVVFALPSHREAEVLALKLLQRMVAGQARLIVEDTHTLATEMEEHIAAAKPSAVVVGVLPPRGVAQTKFLCRRLRTRFPELKVMVALLGLGERFRRAAQPAARVGRQLPVEHCATDPDATDGFAPRCDCCS